MPHKFRLHNPAATQTSIFLDVSFRGRRYKKQLGQTIYSADWNETAQRCRIVRRNELAEAINQKIDTWETAVKETIKHFTPLAETPTQEEFWEKFASFLAGPSDKPQGAFFVDFVEEYGRKVESTHSQPYRWRVARLVKLLKEAEERIYRRRLRFEDIDMDFYRAFQRLVYEKKQSGNTFGSYIKLLKTICLDARQLGINECKGIEHRGFVVVQETADTIYLTEEELLRIHALRFTPETVERMCRMLAEKEGESPDRYLQMLGNPRVMETKIRSCEIVRAKFLIGAFTALRVSDFNSLTPNNIRGDFMVVPVKKSGYTRKVTIPIHWVVREILDSGFDVATPIAEQNINDHIKEICLLAGITDEIEFTRNVGGKRIREVKEKWRLVTNHTARRSAATNMYKSGIPSLAIMQITGHTTEKSFLKYIKVSAEENAELLARHSFFAKKR